MDLTCPKCQGTMRTYERNGVHVDQCTECRGIFLDRGELERLVDAENAWHGSGRARQPAPPPAGRHDSPAPAPHSAPPLPGGALGAVVGEVLKQGRAGQHGSSHGSSHGYGTHGKKKQQSFLSDLFS